MTAILRVCWDTAEEPIGEVVRKSDGTAAFRYAKNGRRISHSLPFDAGDREHPITFFENLLPDGVQRERLARRLGVSDASTFSMLEAVGGDCAGALSLLPDGVPPRRAPASLRPLDKDLMLKILEFGAVPTSVTEGLRLSLAGAQDKVPVIVRDGQLFLPEGAAASTHILKLPNDDYGGLVDNEHFLLELAKEVGLNVVRSQLWKLPNNAGNALLIDRFDRADTGRRLHQEDFCQATNAPPSKKYEIDGGPSLIDIVRVLDAATTEPTDIVHLVKWHAFNVATGNNDGHAKNISLLREPAVRLAPAYDLVCTRAWENLGKDIAFRVGGSRDAGATGPHAWRSFADEAKVSAKLVLESAALVSTRVLDAAASVAARLIDEGANERAIRRALEHVQQHARRSLRLRELEKEPLAKKVGR